MTYLLHQVGNTVLEHLQASHARANQHTYTLLVKLLVRFRIVLLVQACVREGLL